MSHFFRIAPFVVLGSLLASAPTSRGAEPESGAYKGGVSSTLVLKTAKTSSGDPVRYLATEKPEVTALIVDFPPGTETGWHLHTVPVYSWVVSGSVSVEMEGGKTRTFREGDAIVEMVGIRHVGRNTGIVPAKLLVFYTGAEGEPIVHRTP
jgi:quercetin dioxygenase-like cupin family protein